jgi:hypothetical protein
LTRDGPELCLYEEGSYLVISYYNSFCPLFLSLVKAWFGVLYITNCQQIIMKSDVAESFHPES